MLQVKEKKGWFWYIPLHNNIVSVGVVGDFGYLFKDRGTMPPCIKRNWIAVRP